MSDIRMIPNGQMAQIRSGSTTLSDSDDLMSP